MNRALIAAAWIAPLALVILALARSGRVNHGHPQFPVLVTGRLVDQGSGSPLAGAWIMVAPDRSSTDDERAYWTRAHAESWTEDRARFAPEQVAEHAPLRFGPRTCGCATCVDDGTFEALVVVSFMVWYRDDEPTSAPTPPPRHRLGVLRIDIEGRDPVILDAPEGTWTEHDAWANHRTEDVLWATYDLGTVEVPGSSREAGDGGAASGVALAADVESEHGVASSPRLAGAPPSSAGTANLHDVEIVVRGWLGNPIPHAPVRIWRDGAKTPRIMETDDRGILIIPSCRFDYSVRVSAGPAGAPECSVRIMEERHVIEMPPRCCNVRIEPFDAETGEPVAGVKWRPGGGACSLRPAGTPQVIHLDAEGHWLSQVHMEIPAGYVTWVREEGGPPWANTHLNPYTRTCVFRQPLGKEAQVLVELREPDGRLASVPGEFAFYVRNPDRQRRPQILWGTVDEEGPGVARLRGLPFLRDTSVGILLPRATCPCALDKAQGSECYGHGARLVCVLGSDPQATHRLRTLLRAPTKHPLFVPERMTSFTSMSNWLEEEEFEEEEFEDVAPSDRAGASIVVTVLRRDGLPAQGAWVWGPEEEDEKGRYADGLATDANGQVRFEDVEPGTWWVGVRADGLLPASRQITVFGTRSYEVTLEEPEGATLEVVVIDERGDPLPCAAVSFYGWYHTDWIDLGQGVQRVDPYTGHDGTRVFDHVRVGQCALRATWADRIGGEVVHLVDGQRTRVEIVLRPRD